jgi:ubiquinone biosynthesis protein UbiJ
VTDPASDLTRRLANRVLGDEAWARDKLRVHAGRAFSLTSGPVSTAYVVRTDGTLDALEGGTQSPDAELVLSPFDVPSFLADPSRFDALVRAQGDEGFVATLRELAVTLPWFVERAFAKAFGPVVGQRLADTGRALLGFPEYAQGRLTDSVASFARDEANVVARGDEARAFAREAGELAARVDALAERVDRLIAATDPSLPSGSASPPA